MTRIRLIPLVAFATAALFVLKTMALIGHGGYVLTGTQTATAEQAAAAAEGDSPAAQDGAAADGAAAPADAGMAGDAGTAGDAGMAGEGGMAADAAMAGEGGDAAKVPDAAKAEESPEPPLFGKKVELGGKTETEEALLGHLGERRKALDDREQQLKLRESLLAAAEKRLEDKVRELKALEQQVDTAVTRKQEEKSAELGRLITMYENMKPKDAAKVFDRLAMNVLVDVVRKMNPRKMAPILAKMTPEAAERLTVELAGQSAAEPDVGPRQLPKIEGRPIPAPGG